jgi:hypothetical protein
MSRKLYIKSTETDSIPKSDTRQFDSIPKSDTRQFDIDSTGPVVGRSNPHILCFFNSLRAALESCSSFNEILETHYELIPIFGKCYIRCIKNNHQNTGIEDGSVLAKIYIKVLKNKGIDFGDRQEDASEGIDWFFHCYEAVPISVYSRISLLILQTVIFIYRSS